MLGVTAGVWRELRAVPDRPPRRIGVGRGVEVARRDRSIPTAEDRAAQ